MSQRLILPMNRCIITAGYKNPLYLKQQGYEHYGLDMYGETGQNVTACGDGFVFSCGYDELFGITVIIVYRDVELHDGRIIDLSCRMYHFSKVEVIRGQRVKKGDLIGTAGNTGSATVNGRPMGIHLHTEFDTEIQYPHLAFVVKQSGTIVKKGTVDSTINPSNIWFLGEGQVAKGRGSGWFDKTDIELPKC